MNIYIGAWFNEPGINFKFSYKITNYIVKNIREKYYN